LRAAGHAGRAGGGRGEEARPGALARRAHRCQQGRWPGHGAAQEGAAQAGRWRAGAPGEEHGRGSPGPAEGARWGAVGLHAHHRGQPPRLRVHRPRQLRPAHRGRGRH